MAREGTTSTAHSPAPSTTGTRPHLRHRDGIWSPRLPRIQNYRVRKHHSSPEGELSYVIWGLPRTSTFWRRADTHSPAGYPCGWGGALESEGPIQGTRLPGKKEDVPSHPYPIRTSPLSTKDKTNTEDGRDLPPQLATSTLRLSVAPSCIRLTSVQDQNKAAVPSNLIVESDKIGVCCCPQYGLGPDTSEGDLPCRVFRCPQCESPPLAWKGKHPCFGGLLIVWTCAAPSSGRFTGAPLAPRLNRPPAFLGTVLNIFLRKMDSPHVTEVKRPSPIRRVNRLHTTNSERGLPVRRLSPLCTTASGDRTTPASRPLSVITRAFLSIGGVDVGIRIPLCEYGLVKRVHGGVRRLDQSWTVAARSKEVVPIRRVNRSCTTSCTTTWERECEDSVPIDLPSRSKSRCPKREGNRTRRPKKEVHPSLQVWPWQDFCCCRCSADFSLLWRDCRGLNLIITVTVKQSDRVSSPSYPPIHLFSLHPDLQETDLLRWKRTTLLYPLKPGWETQARAPKALRESGHTPVSIWLSVATTFLPRSPHLSSPPPSIPGPTATPLMSLSMGDMGLQARICTLLMGLAITTSAHHVHRGAALGSLMGLISAVSTDRFTLQNGYGTVEARYHLTAYDCSDPSEVQAYSSIPASHCSTRATPVKTDRPTRFQLLQKEKKRYINAYVCSLFRTDIRYNCGVYGHPELDPMHWSFLIPQRVTVEQCLEWLRTRTYRPAYHSTMMHGKEFTRPVLVNEPNYITYLVYGRTFLQAPALPTDLVTDVACQGEWYEYQPDKPQNHVVAFYDELHLQTVTLVVEDEKVIDKDRQLSLPCPWNDGHCHAEGLTYLWNVTGPEYRPVAVVKEFLGHRLHANVSQSGDSYDSHHAEAIVSAEMEEKIRIQPTGPVSQCGRVVTSTNIEDMFLFPILETDDKGRMLTDNRDQVFERRIHPGEVDLWKYIANRDEYLYYDITSQAEREFDTILHQDCLRRQDEARKAHFFEHGLPGYQPFLLQDGAFSTRSGETNYRYQCLPRTVHPVSASRCYNKLPVFLRLPQHLAAGTTLNFSASHTYFLDLDSRLLSQIASEVPCSALFPAVYQTHQGWIAVTPDIHQAPSPKPLPVQPPAEQKMYSVNLITTKEASTNPTPWMPCRTSC